MGRDHRARVEEIRLGVAAEEGLEDLLGLRAHDDDAILAPPGGLVPGGAIFPVGLAGGQVAAAHGHDLLGAAAGEELDADHGGDDAIEVRQGRLDELDRDGLDLVGLAGVGPPLLEAGDRLEGLMDRGRDHLQADGPLERRGGCG